MDYSATGLELYNRWIELRTEAIKLGQPTTSIDLAYEYQKSVLDEEEE